MRIEYPIESRDVLEDRVLIKAGIKSVDEQRRIRYEGFSIPVPLSVADDEHECTVCAVDKTAEHDVFTIHIWGHVLPPEDGGHASGDCYIDAGGDLEIDFQVSRDVLKRWTELSGRDIDIAFGSLKKGATMKLLESLPETVIIKKDAVIVELSEKRGYPEQPWYLKR